MERTNLKKKSDLHLARKVWHATGVSAMAGLYHLLGPHGAWITLLVSAAVLVPIDILRQSNSRLNRLAVRFLGPVMRQSEFDHLSGLSYLVLGTLILISFADRHVLTLTLLFLAFGDPVASFFGIRYGKDRLIGNKTLQGTLAAFAVCSLIAVIYYYAHNLMTERLLIVVPLSGAIGAVSEAVPVGRLDDNLTFPVICGLLLWALFHLFGGFGV